MIPLSHYLVLGAILFGISVVGIFLNRKNVVILLMSIELLLLAVNYQLYRLFPLSRRYRGAGVRIFYSDRSCR